MILDSREGVYPGMNYRAAKKKGPMLNWSTSVNFGDIKTLIPSKERIFDIVFGGNNFKMRQLLF